jgi:hypothetical protein
MARLLWCVVARQGLGPSRVCADAHVAHYTLYGAVLHLGPAAYSVAGRLIALRGAPLLTMICVLAGAAAIESHRRRTSHSPRLVSCVLALHCTCSGTACAHLSLVLVGVQGAKEERDQPLCGECVCV